jgi:hypothetical protein
MNKPQILKENPNFQRNPNYERTPNFKRRSNFQTNPFTNKPQILKDRQI